MDERDDRRFDELRDQMARRPKGEFKQLALRAGCAIEEVPGLTREELVPFPARPILLLPAGLSTIARERMIAAKLFGLVWRRDPDGLTALLARVARE